MLQTFRNFLQSIELDLTDVNKLNTIFTTLCFAIGKQENPCKIRIDYTGVSKDKPSHVHLDFGLVNLDSTRIPGQPVYPLSIDLMDTVDASKFLRICDEYHPLFPMIIEPVIIKANLEGR